MKRTTAILLLSLAFAAIHAEFVTPDQAARTATLFMTGHEASKVHSALPGNTGNRPELELACSYQPDGSAPASFYIFNREDGSGFVIVSAESETRQILAYSNEGPFHVDHMDKGAAEFLKSYDRAINAVRYGKSIPVAGNAGRYQPKQLETAAFDQNGYSFNTAYAPKVGGKPCQAGCVATAMGIIMKYHNWPTRSSGSHSYTMPSGVEMSYDFSKNPFDWKSISNVPDAKSSAATSQLLKACGISINMEYGPEESWSYFALVNYALRHYFYYNYPYQIFRDEMDTDDWETIMRSEIDNGRPVFIGGVAKIGGHAYVLDGYDSEGIFHYNLGWGGVNNGYYTEGKISSECYANTDAIIGIEPRSIDQEDFTAPFQYSSIKMAKVDNPYYQSYFNIDAKNFMNIANVPFSGKVRADIYDKDLKLKANIHTGFDESEHPLGTGSYYLGYGFYYCHIPGNVRIYDTDRIIISTSTDNGKSWQPVFCASDHFRYLYANGRVHDDIANISGTVSGLAHVFTVNGTRITSFTASQDDQIPDGLEPGIYIIRYSSGKTVTRLIP